MPSKKPKIQGIIEPHLYERFTEWRKTIDAPNDGVGLNRLFALFFNEPIEEIPFNIADITILNDRVNQLIAEMNEMKKVKEAIDQFKVIDVNGFNERLSQLELAVSTSLQPIKSQNDIPYDTEDILYQNEDIFRDNQDIQDTTLTIGFAVAQDSVEENDRDITTLDISQDNQDIPIENLDIPYDTGDRSSDAAPLDGENEEKEKPDDIQRDNKDISLSGVQLGKRLKCSEAAIRSHRKKGDLAKWTSRRDPEGRAWKYENDRYCTYGRLI